MSFPLFSQTILPFSSVVYFSSPLKFVILSRFDTSLMLSLSETFKVSLTVVLVTSPDGSISTKTVSFFSVLAVSPILLLNNVCKSDCLIVSEASVCFFSVFFDCVFVVPHPDKHQVDIVITNAKLIPF